VHCFTITAITDLGIGKNPSPKLKTNKTLNESIKRY